MEDTAARYIKDRAAKYKEDRAARYMTGCSHMADTAVRNMETQLPPTWRVQLGVLNE
jgi:hypothetical protein